MCIRRILPAILLCVILLAACGRAEYENCITVMLTAGEGYSCDDPVIRLMPGEDAIFPVTLEDGYEFIQFLGADAEYSGGIVRVKNVRYPATVLPVAVRDPEPVRFILERTDNAGKATSSVPEGKLPRGTHITVTASPFERSVFVGWSFGKKAADGGLVVSVRPEFSFVLESNTILYANFRVIRPEKQIQTVSGKYLRTILYAANGGSTKDGSAIRAETVTNEFYPMPNTLPDTGVFTRDGYTLLGYTTEPDGTGAFYGPGHPMPVPDDPAEVTILYCLWQKWSPEQDFTYGISGNGAAITRYTGSAENVAIPAVLGGKSVTTIAAGAFSGCLMREVILPNTIRTVEPDAFRDCAEFTELTMSDTVRVISDECFSGTTHLRTLRLNAAMAPRYSTNNFSIKWERLLMNADKNRVIVFSGSSTYHGLLTPQLEELLSAEGNDYCVCNFGTHAESNIVFNMDVCSSVLHEGDVVVYAPEQLPYVIGSTALTKINFSGFELCYDCFARVDISKYTNVFGAFREFNDTRVNMRERTYAEHAASQSIYGERDAGLSPKLNSETFRLGANGTFYYREGIIPDENAKRINAVFAQIRAKGAEPLVSFPPFNRNAVEPETLNEAGYDAYNGHIAAVLGAELISDVRDYVFNAKYMSDTDYHLNDAGRDIRTRQLAADLNAHFRKRK